MYAYPVVADYVYPDAGEVEKPIGCQACGSSMRCTPSLAGIFSLRRVTLGGSLSTSRKTPNYWSSAPGNSRAGAAAHRLGRSLLP